MPAGQTVVPPLFYSCTLSLLNFSTLLLIDGGVPQVRFFLPGSWGSLLCELRALCVLCAILRFTLCSPCPLWSTLFHSFTLPLAHSFQIAAPHPKLSSRPERPDFLFRAAFWRVGPRSGGIAAPTARHKHLLHTFALSLLYSFSVLLSLFPPATSSQPTFVLPLSLC